MDEIAPGVFVATADLYTTTTTVVAGADGGCLLIDPAVTVADLAALAGWLSERGLRPVAGWSTHPHWDHLLWSAAFGDVPRYATPRAVAVAARELPGLVSAVGEAAPGHDLTLFARVEPLLGREIDWAGPRAVVLAHDAHAPGHGAVLLPEAGVLIAGDMLLRHRDPAARPGVGRPVRRLPAGTGTARGRPRRAAGRARPRPRRRSRRVPPAGRRRPRLPGRDRGRRRRRRPAAHRRTGCAPSTPATANGTGARPGRRAFRVAKTAPPVQRGARGRERRAPDSSRARRPGSGDRSSAGTPRTAGRPRPTAPTTPRARRRSPRGRSSPTCPRRPAARPPGCARRL